MDEKIFDLIIAEREKYNIVESWRVVKKHGKRYAITIKIEEEEERQP